MTATKLIEYRIAQQLLQRRQEGAAEIAERSDNPWTDRCIAILAVATGLLLVGSYVEELLWAVVAVTTVITLR